MRDTTSPRIHKFRAYHIGCARWDYFTLADIYQMGKRGCWDWDDYANWCASTGLFDKAKKEIFEGDIVITSSGGQAQVVFGELENVECGAEGSQCEGIGFFFVRPNWITWLSAPWEDAQYEVIGNTYDDPELLTEPKKENPK